MQLPNLPVAAEFDPRSGKYILHYDASLHQKSNCARYVFYRLISGLRLPGKDFKMEYGTAFHKAMRGFYGGKPIEAAMEDAIAYYSRVSVPEGEWRNIAHLANVVLQYGTYWKQQGDTLKPDVINGKPLLEQNFAVPIYSDDVMEVLLSGTLDFKGTYNSRSTICDHKTTAIRDVNGYLAKADLSPQLMVYVLIYTMLFPTEPRPGAMLNGIFLSQTNKNQFVRSDVVEFDDYKLKVLHHSIMARVTEVVEHFKLFLDKKEGVFPPNYTCCEQQYGMCEFAPLCRQSDNSLVETLVKNNYETSVYDPLKFQNE